MSTDYLEATIGAGLQQGQDVVNGTGSNGQPYHTVSNISVTLGPLSLSNLQSGLSRVPLEEDNGQWIPATATETEDTDPQGEPGISTYVTTINASGLVNTDESGSFYLVVSAGTPEATTYQGTESIVETMDLGSVNTTGMATYTWQEVINEAVTYQDGGKTYNDSFIETQDRTASLPVSLSPVPNASLYISTDQPTVTAGGTATFTVSLDHPLDYPVTVQYATKDGTAVAGRDYTAESGDLTFAPGQLHQTVSVPLLTNPNASGNPVFYVDLTAPSASGGPTPGISVSEATETFYQVPPPSVQQLADMSNAVYSAATSVGAYEEVQAAGFGPDGLAAIAYRDGNQIVVAFRGTVFDLPNVLTGIGPGQNNLFADGSWVSGTPTSTFSTYVNEAALFLAFVHANYPNASITLTGHSLGGALAELLSDASGYSSTTFNAPGPKQFEPDLQIVALVPASALRVTGPALPNTNYRVYGDQVSLAGVQTGSTVILGSSYPDTYTNALNNHSINTVIANLNNIYTGPTDTMLPGLDVLVADANGNSNFPPLSVTRGQDIGIDPAGASRFILTETPDSPRFATITLPGGEPGVVSYSLVTDQNGTLSAAQNVQPTQVIQLPSDTDSIQFQALDANGNPVIVGDPGILDVTFATDGVFTGSLDVDPSTKGSVSLPGPFGDVAVSDTTTGLNVLAVGQNYFGPVAGLQHQYVYSGSDNINISVSDGNWFLHGGPGDDAIAAFGGYNVLDGGTGSNFLTGGATGTDTFFVDDRGPPADIWSTVNGFHKGDDATVFGIVPKADNSNVQWFDNQGATGYTGLTLHVPTPGQPTASLTLTGYASSDLSNGRLAVQFGNEADGTPFMHVIANG